MKRPALLLCLLALPSCGSSQGSSPPAAASPYRATSVGRIDSAGEARELVAQVDGVIVGVLVRRGERVRAGQVLLEVGCQPLAAAAQAAKAVARQSAARGGSRQRRTTPGGDRGGAGCLAHLRGKPDRCPADAEPLGCAGGERLCLAPGT
ncbi:biotin/lipoyl-binding protein [Novosphingobium sp. MW5]|nr:biotin/lipoyl-binding protein [Novosphingobium sp. MW5]